MKIGFTQAISGKSTRWVLLCKGNLASYGYNYSLPRDVFSFFFENCERARTSRESEQGALTNTPLRWRFLFSYARSTISKEKIGLLTGYFDEDLVLIEMIESFVSDVKQSPLFLSSLLVIWLGCPGEGEWLINGFTSRLAGKGLAINCVALVSLHRPLTLLKLNKIIIIWLACLESAVSGMR